MMNCTRMCLRLLSVALCSLALVVSGTKLKAATTSFDKDLDEDCPALVHKCTKDPKVWAQCPISCARSLAPQETHHMKKLKDEAFFELTGKDRNGKTIRFENYDGYVTMICMVPMLPGMAQYHYEMLEHLQKIYPYTLETIFLPLGKKRGGKLVPHDDGKVIVMDDEATEVLKFFQALFKNPSEYKDVKELAKKETKVTCFIVSADGDWMEAHYSPTLATLEKYVAQDMHKLDKDYRTAEF